MKVVCELNGQECLLPDYISQFILSASFIYCATLNDTNNPQIHPLLFVNELGKCLLSFIQNINSDVIKNLQRHPYLALTIDNTDPENPFSNTGIMIEAIVKLSTSNQHIQNCFELLREKYGDNIVTKVLGIDIDTNYIKIQARPLKIVYWKGPFFQTYKCKQKKYT